MLSEEEIIEILKGYNVEKHLCSLCAVPNRKACVLNGSDCITEAIQGLLDLYQKEKEKNIKAIEYISKNCSTNNCDFMDDGVGNLFKDILELLEERN